jgi:hypothetical protein
MPGDIAENTGGAWCSAWLLLRMKSGGVRGQNKNGFKPKGLLQNRRLDL